MKWFLHGSTIGLKEESNLPPLVNIFAPEDMNREVWKVETAALSVADDGYTTERYPQRGCHARRPRDSR